MVTVTLSEGQLSSVKWAVKEKIEAMEERVRLLDTDYADQPAQRAHWHTYYANELAVFREVLAKMEAL